MKKNLLNLKTMVIALALALSGTAHAFTAVTSGNWSSAATWGGVAPGSMVSAADIIIPSGIIVSLDTDVTFSGLAINTFSVGGTLSSTTNNKLILTQGIFTGAGIVSIRKIMFSGLNIAAFTGTLTVNEMVNSSTSLAFIGTANVSDSLILEAGNLALNSNANLALTTGATIRVRDGILNTGGGILNTANNYNVMYVGGSKTTGIELNSSTVQNLTVKLMNNTQALTLANNTTINNNVDIAMGVLFFGGKKLTLKGDVSIGSSGAGFGSDQNSDLLIEGTNVLTTSLFFTTNAALNTLTIDRPTTVKVASPLNIKTELNLLSGTLSLEAGAVLTMNTGSKVHVEAGTLALNTGNFVGTANYSVEYMGTTNSTTGTEVNGTGLTDVKINFTNPTSKVMLGSNLTLSGSLNMMNGSLDLNGRNITLNGTLTQSANATFIGNAASEMNLNLSTAANSSLFFDNSNQTLSKLKVNIAGTSALMLGTALSIKNELMFASGKLMIDNADLIIQSTGNITGYSDTRYIVTSGTGNGRLQMSVTSGGAFVTFPVGTTVNYSPAYIQQNSAGTSGKIMVKAMNDVLTAGYAGFPLGTTAAVSRTWFIDAESSVTVDMNLKLGWMVSSEVNGFNRNTAMLRHFTNGAWDTYAIGTASTGANSTFELSRTGLTSLSPFAVADANAPLKVTEETNAIDFKMFPNPAKDLITLKVPATTDSFKYDVIDITGRLVSTTEKTGNIVNINVTDLYPGCYFIKTTNLTTNSSGVKRFIKE